MKKIKKTILVVEDEDVIRKVCAEELEDSGFNVLTANNGKVGVDVALSKHPDLILIDLLMPEMDGMTALKIIRQDKWGKTVPVIILTNLNPDKESLVKDMVANKPLFYLVKADWKIGNVVKKIEEIVT